MKEESYDVFVIGSGTAGKLVAENCAREGLKVAIAENREYGGTCANRGCDPKKVLLGPTEIIQRTNDMVGKDIFRPLKLNFKKLQKFKKSFTTDVSKNTKEGFEKLGIKMFYQTPEFIDKKVLKIGDTQVLADKIIIATGNIPRALDIKGSEYLKNSDDFLLLKKVPKKVVFIGAGYIGMEFAHLAARAGSKVVVIDEGQGSLQKFDKDLVSLLESTSQKLGIQFIFNAGVNSVQKNKKKLEIEYTIDNKTKFKKADIIYNTTGRVPSISMLNLEVGGVDYNAKGIAVDNYLRSKSNKDVYACGDVSDFSLSLTPLSGIEGNIVSKNIINGNKHKIEIPLVPTVVFTIPNLASVGYAEEEAKKRYKNISVKYGEISGWFNNKRINGDAYAYKIIINDRTNLIVGAHILSPEAAEIINLFTLAMNANIKIDVLRKMIFTYPSWSNDIKSMLS
ncbi:NAD(P)/FAD-dependent oxidoreductase [Cellulophaga sp. F20128]|uniref:dihydrolipoyl dehydrogenase family protein n=1 Tax=Cellulophaga sp. F20128 TaxID=2926413 RepID=UPI001FF392F4|nr:NAD(P)/FAD-dependent oxidoreductase [Cellulophaga sp. F20128]MCK0156550.1 NAD(P)/FAD-dependent oxidoreductase [Cellulophaga sp. F20128]